MTIPKLQKPEYRSGRVKTLPYKFYLVNLVASDAHIRPKQNQGLWFDVGIERYVSIIIFTHI